MEGFNLKLSERCVLCKNNCIVSVYTYLFGYKSLNYKIANAQSGLLC